MTNQEIKELIEKTNNEADYRKYLISAQENDNSDSLCVNYCRAEFPNAVEKAKKIRGKNASLIAEKKLENGDTILVFRY